LSRSKEDAFVKRFELVSGANTSYMTHIHSSGSDYHSKDMRFVLYFHFIDDIGGAKRLAKAFSSGPITAKGKFFFRPTGIFPMRFVGIA